MLSYFAVGLVVTFSNEVYTGIEEVKMTSIVWDMGGTLIDTYPQVDNALANVVSNAGGSVTISEVASLTRGSIESAIEILARRFAIDPRLLEEANDAVKASWQATPAPLMDGALEVMAAVKDSGGLNLVVTHRDRESAMTLVEQHGLAVDDMLCAPDGYPRKPDPTMYRAIMERNTVDAAIAVGDRDIDTLAGNAAGLPTAFLTTPGLTTHADGAAATWNIGSLRELLTLL